MTAPTTTPAAATTAQQPPRLQRTPPAAVAQALAAVALCAGTHTVLVKLGLASASVSPLFALGFLVVAGAALGAAMSAFGLPRLVGALAAGVLVGPQALGLVGTADLSAIALANVLALALIALQAGAEITLASLARVYRSVLLSAGTQTLVMVGVTGAAFLFAAPHIPFMSGVDPRATLAIAALWGVFMLTRSPSVTMALVTEVRAKGPLTEHALGVVVLLDVLVLPLFAAALAFARGSVLGAPFEMRAFEELGGDLLASALGGLTFGLVLAALLRFTKERILVVVVFGYAVTAVCSYLHYDTLLLFVVAGFVVTNLTRRGHTLVQTSEKTASGVMIVFFATAGAKIDLASLAQLWPLVILFCVVRLVATVVSVRFGHALARDPPMVKRYGWLTLISQAGVTIGLATVVADALPEIGRPFASLVIAIVSVNTFFGAILCRFGLDRAGEVGAALVGNGDDATAVPA